MYICTSVQAPLGTLNEGDVITAEIEGIHLYHGAVINLGTQYHGMIPVTEDQWPDVVDILELDTTVKVRVHKARSRSSQGLLMRYSRERVVFSLCLLKISVMCNHFWC